MPRRILGPDVVFCSERLQPRLFVLLVKLQVTRFALRIPIPRIGSETPAVIHVEGGLLQAKADQDFSTVLVGS
jgi:hypothetical protein